MRYYYVIAEDFLIIMSATETQVVSPFHDTDKQIGIIGS